MTPNYNRIIHLDMDAFYASVEILDTPSLQGKPVIVGGTSKRGVVSAASYVAREFGVHSALPITIAKQRCPHGIFLPPRLNRYQEISAQIMAIFKRFTPLVEPLSLDEAFLDVTGSKQLFGPAERIAATIRKSVHNEIGLTVSAGVSTTKLLAKIASDINKPNGLTVVPPGQEQHFLAPLAISKLWGVGKTTFNTLSQMGIKTIGDLSRLPSNILEKKFGKHGTDLFLASHAIDHRNVEPKREIKSIGHEDTFAVDLRTMPEIKKKLLSLSIRVGERMRRYSLTGKTITVKVKYPDFRQQTRSSSFQPPTDDSMTIYNLSLKLLEKTQAGEVPLRLLGVSLANLQPKDSPRQGLLFKNDRQTEKINNLNKAIDSINSRYLNSNGIKQIQPARLL